MTIRTSIRIVCLCALLAALPPAARAQTAGPSTAPAGAEDVTALAKTTQNPVGDIISVPFEFNFNNGGALSDQTAFNLNFQPVIPITLTKNWSIISRTIVPIHSFPGTEGSRFSGVGDIQQQLYFTPAKAGSLIWGAGPVFSMPTATADPARTGTWAAGAGLVVLKMAGPFVLGGLVNQYSPVSDANGKPKTNLFLFQWFVNYNFGKGWALSVSPLNTANWDAEEGQRWTVPLGLGISRTFVFNRQPMTLGLTYTHNIVRPDGAPSNQLRLRWALIFPKMR